MKYRGEISEFNTSIPTVSFKEFLLHLRDAKVVSDPHWKPLIKHRCGICRIKYDFVLKLENIADELDYIYRQVNDGVEMPWKFPVPEDKYGDEQKWSLLKDVPFVLLNETLVKVYGDDYRAFDYTMPNEHFIRSSVTITKSLK